MRALYNLVNSLSMIPGLGFLSSVRNSLYRAEYTTSKVQDAARSAKSLGAQIKK